MRISSKLNAYIDGAYLRTPCRLKMPPGEFRINAFATASDGFKSEIRSIDSSAKLATFSVNRSAQKKSLSESAAK